MNRLALLAAVPVALGAVLAGCGPPRALGAPRNLVIVLIDTLRQDRLASYGYSRETSPFLDRMAREGARLEGRSTASWTKPAVTSLLTGLHPLRHQVATGGDALPPEVVTLAQILQREGYSTAAVSTNGWFSRAWGQDRGFETFLPLWTLGYGRFPKASEVNGEVARLLPDLRPPFFLFVHYLDPHMPYDPPAAWDGAPLAPEVARLRPLGRADFDLGGRQLPHQLALAASELYDGEIRAVDRGVEELSALLAAAGRSDRTLWVVTSDHGEEFLEHGQVGHGKTLYEEVVRVPLLVKGPGVQPGTRPGPAALEDIAPTVLELLGVSPDLPEGHTFDGRSFAARLSGAAGAPPKEEWLGYLEGEQGASVAAVADRHKLILALDPYRKELFDLRTDPGERASLFAAAAAAPSGFAGLADRLADRYNDLTRRAWPRHSTTADAGLRDQLTALGYLKLFADKGARRAFPRRLKPADGLDGGLRGWENRAAFVSCGDLVDFPNDQLLMGWYALEPALGGRWAAPAATLALPPGAGSIVRLTGVSYRPDAARLSVSWDGRPARIAEIQPGAPFTVEVETPGTDEPGRYHLLRLGVEPPFRPIEVGSSDARVLGTFVTSICRSGQLPDQRR